MEGQGHDIVVIGASAGGFQAVSDVISGLPVNLRAAVFIVIHVSSENSVESMVNYFQRNTQLNFRKADNGRFEYGCIYLAPPDRHLLLKEDKMILTKGPSENKYRPSIDHLFRSAAAYYGSRAIGVILTGLMEDGTAGMASLGRSGGITIVQDPQDAIFSDMPLSVLGQVNVDIVLPVAKISSEIEKLVSTPAIQRSPIPPEVIKEAQIAERVAIGMEHAGDTGKLSSFTCPDCGGALWGHEEEKLTHYRCHTGHCFTDSALLKFKSTEVEDTLWVVMRMLEEKRNLLKVMSDKNKLQGGRNFSILSERAKETEVHIERIKEILLYTPALPNIPDTSKTSVNINGVAISDKDNVSWRKQD